MTENAKYSKLYLTVLTTVTLLYFRSSDFIHPTAESLYPLPSSSHFPSLQTLATPFQFSICMSFTVLFFNSTYIYHITQSSICLCLALSLSIKPKGPSVLSHIPWSPVFSWLNSIHRSVCVCDSWIWCPAFPFCLGPWKIR